MCFLVSDQVGLIELGDFFRFPEPFLASLRTKVLYTHKVVDTQSKGEHPRHFFFSSEHGSSHKTYVFQPTKNFFHSFSFSLTDFVAFVSRRTSINRAGVFASVKVLRHMRRYIV